MNRFDRIDWFERFELSLSEFRSRVEYIYIYRCIDV